MIQKYCFRGAEYTVELIENIMHDWCLDLMIKSIIMKSDIYYTTCWRVIMKVWSVCFPDSFSRSHAHMFFIYLSFFLQGLWIIVWIWAFFFLLLGLEIFNKGILFGPPKPNLLFWAYKIKIWIWIWMDFYGRLTQHRQSEIIDTYV